MDLHNSYNIHKCAAEAIGTFWLTFAGCGSAVIAAAFPEVGIGLLGVALAFGLTVLTMAYAIGHISGCHLNPAVTVGLWAGGRFPRQDILPYVVAQVIGAVAAAMTVSFLKGSPQVVAMELDATRGLLAEILFTFALCYVVLNVATAKGTEGNSFYGLAIGFTVLAGAFAVGPVSGGAFNPAVAVGLTALGVFKAANIWIYLLGNFGGAALAATVFKFVNGNDSAVS